MAFNFKEVMNKPERLAPGHRMCAGCGSTLDVGYAQGAALQLQ